MTKQLELSTDEIMEILNALYTSTFDSKIDDNQLQLIWDIMDKINDQVRGN